MTSEEMIERLEERKIATGQFSGAYVEYRLDERRLDWFSRAMERKGIHINSPYLVKMFKSIERVLGE